MNRALTHALAFVSLAACFPAFASEPWDSCDAQQRDPAVRGAIAAYSGTASPYPRSFSSSDYSVVYLHADLEAAYPSDTGCFSGDPAYQWGAGVGSEINHLYRITKDCAKGADVHHTAALVGARACSRYVSNGQFPPVD